MFRSSRRVLAVVAAATVVSIVAACGETSAGGNEASDTGVTEDTITLGAHYPLTGAAAPGYSEIPTGVQAYFDHVNDNGGVHGREIEYVYRDDGYDPDRAAQVVDQLVREDEVFAVVGGFGSRPHDAVAGALNAAGVPDLFVASGSRMWGEDPATAPFTFGWQPDHESEGKIIGHYIAENVPDARVGLFLQDDLGVDGESGLRRYIDGQIVASERYMPGDRDVSAQITRLQAAGADVVVGFTMPGYTALSQLAAAGLGYEPQWIYSHAGSDPQVVGSLLAEFSQGAVSGAARLGGVLTTDYLPTTDEPDNPWVQQFQRIWDEHGDQGELTNFRLYGMSLAYVTVQALQSAGRNPTRTGIVEAIEQEGRSWRSPVLAPFRYSEDSHLGTSGMSVIRLTPEGGAEDVQDVMVTDIGDAEVEPLDDDPATPPETGIPDERPYDGSG